MGTNSSYINHTNTTIMEQFIYFMLGMTAGSTGYLTIIRPAVINYNHRQKVRNRRAEYPSAKPRL